MSIMFAAVLLLILILIKIFTPKSPKKVFLLDFACFKGKQTQFYTNEKALALCKHYNNPSNDMLDFVSKMLDRIGVGQKGYIPDSLVMEPPNPCLALARNEAEEVLFGVVDQVLEKSGVKAEDIGIVVVNCSLFNTTPSIADMIVNKYKLGEDVLCYNITGMGCSAGLAAIGLAKQLLQVHPNTYCLVLSTENITENFYKGKNRSMIIANTLFRVGGAAILLSNRPSDRHISKYQLIHTISNTTASHDRSFKSIFIEEDDDGNFGVNINKDLMIAAIKAIEANVATLAGLVLPVSVQIKFLTTYLIRYLGIAKVKSYIPNFGDHFEHFLPHVGGKPVLDELQKNLGFRDNQMEASRMTLYRFGNTSSSSVWYALAYVEAKGKIKKGDHIWQIAFGTGFKCSSVIWQALRNVDIEETNPWKNEIDTFPVDDVSKFEKNPELFYFEQAK